MSRDEFLTIQEVAELLRVTPTSVRRWVRSGELVAAKFGPGAGYRIGRSDLDRFIEGRKIAA